MDVSRQLSRSTDLAAKVATLFQKRAATAQDNFRRRVAEAYQSRLADLVGKPMTPLDIWTDWTRYSIDFAQRSVLFWDTIRERGNNYLEHVREGAAAGAALPVRDGARRADLRATGELRAAAHRTARGRDGRSEAAPPT